MMVIVIIMIINSCKRVVKINVKSWREGGGVTLLDSKSLRSQSQRSVQFTIYCNVSMLWISLVCMKENTTLMFILASRRRFSAFRSLCTTLLDQKHFKNGKKFKHQNIKSRNLWQWAPLPVSKKAAHVFGFFSANFENRNMWGNCKSHPYKAKGVRPSESSV